MYYSLGKALQRQVVCLQDSGTLKALLLYDRLLIGIGLRRNPRVGLLGAEAGIVSPDLDGDGTNDIVLGNSYWDSGADDAGGAYLLSGALLAAGE